MVTPFDKELLNILQTGLPISHRPFADMGKALGVDEEFVLSRLKSLKEEGYLRRLGPFFDSEKLGYRGSLIAVKVKPDFMEGVATFINGFAGVTHNYEREGKYNLWFTLLTADLAEKNAVLAAVSAQPGVEELLNLESRKKYKINVQFKLK